MAPAGGIRAPPGTCSTLLTFLQFVLFHYLIVITNQIKSKVSSFKSNQNIHKKENASYYVVSANKALSVK